MLSNTSKPAHYHFVAKSVEQCSSAHARHSTDIIVSLGPDHMARLWPSETRQCMFCRTSASPSPARKAAVNGAAAAKPASTKSSRDDRKTDVKPHGPSDRRSDHRSDRRPDSRAERHSGRRSSRGDAPSDMGRSDGRGRSDRSRAASTKDAPSSRGHGSKAAVGRVSATKLNVGKLTRNVTSDHISEIFATFGKIKTAELQVSIHDP